MFWQLGRHFIITAPSARHRSSSSMRIGPSRVNGDGRKEFRMAFTQAQDIVIGDVERAGALDQSPMIIIGLVLGQENDAADGGSADHAQEALQVKTLQIAADGSEGQADMPQHERRHEPAPTAQAEPAAAPAAAVPHHMDVHVGGEPVWRGTCHLGRVHHQSPSTSRSVICRAKSSATKGIPWRSALTRSGPMRT